jgi:methylated-DNA-[protein]-cysteine S-methyltransferase
MLYQTSISTPLGKMWLIASEDGLRVATFSRPKTRNTKESNKHLRQAVKAVASYFAGNHTALYRVKQDLEGTTFQKAIWREMRSVAPGTTISYGALAERAGSPDAVRAAGMACGRNPISLFNP